MAHHQEAEHERAAAKERRTQERWREHQPSSPRGYLLPPSQLRKRVEKASEGFDASEGKIARSFIFRHNWTRGPPALRRRNKRADARALAAVGFGLGLRANRLDACRCISGREWGWIALFPARRDYARCEREVKWERRAGKPVNSIPPGGGLWLRPLASTNIRISLDPPTLCAWSGLLLSSWN